MNLTIKASQCCHDDDDEKGRCIKKRRNYGRKALNDNVNNFENKL